MSAQEDSLPAGTIQLFEAAVPDLTVGSYSAEVTQKVRDGSGEPILHMKDLFPFRVAGPKYRLTPRDILGAFPAPGALEASNLRVPHVALRRRTLPWERTFNEANSADPWMALLLLEVTGEGEGSGGLTLESGASLTRNHDFGGDQRGDLLKASGRLLSRIAPRRDERRLLTHVRKVSLQDTEAEFASDDDGFVAMILSNRLPKVGKRWLAALVSLEDQAHAIGDDWADATTYELPVLFYWTYETADLGGDFQAWAQALHYNGGVHLLGQVPDESKREREPEMDGVGGVELDHRERDGQAEKGLYHGPALAVPMERSPDIILNVDRAREVAAGKYDVSYAAAFELGRLLAMADRGILQALIGYRRQQFTIQRESLLIPRVKPLVDFELDKLSHLKLLERLRGDWVMDQILDKNDLVTDPVDILANKFGHEPGGFIRELETLEGLGSKRLQQMGLGGLSEAMNLPGMSQQVPGLGGLGLGGLDLGGLDLDHQVGTLGLGAAAIEDAFLSPVAQLEQNLGSLLIHNDAVKIDGKF